MLPTWSLGPVSLDRTNLLSLPMDNEGIDILYVQSSCLSRLGSAMLKASFAVNHESNQAHCIRQTPHYNIGTCPVTATIISEHPSIRYVFTVLDKSVPKSPSSLFPITVHQSLFDGADLQGKDRCKLPRPLKRATRVPEAGDTGRSPPLPVTVSSIFSLRLYDSVGLG